MHYLGILGVIGTVLCLRIPRWVESTEGEVPAALRSTERGSARRNRAPMGRNVIVALWGNGALQVFGEGKSFGSAAVVLLAAATVMIKNTSRKKIGMTTAVSTIVVPRRCARLRPCPLDENKLAVSWCMIDASAN
jgi:hypothetical protein